MTEAVTPAFDLRPGLFDFYSSQAELMLAQYENIKRLLGPTTHGTPSGDWTSPRMVDTQLRV